MMTGLAAVFYGLGAAVIAAIFAYLKGRLSGAAAERDKQAKRETKARDIADQVDQDVGALSPEQRRAELRKWSR